MAERPPNPEPWSRQRESVQEYRTLFEHAGLGLAQVGLDGRFLRVNGTLARLLGRSVAEVQALTWTELTHPDDVRMNRRLAAQLLRGDGNTYSIEKRYRRTRGDFVWVNLTAALVRDTAGQAAYFAVAVEDISQRKAVESERDALLRTTVERAAELEAVFEATPSGLVVYGPLGDVRRMNTEAAGLTGYGGRDDRRAFSDRLRAQDVRLADGTPLAPAEAPVTRALQGETIRNLTLRQTSGGRTRWVTANTAPIRTPDESVAGVVTSLTDVTLLRELQERTEDLLHTISHDLRSPLAAVQLHAQLLERTLGGDPARARRSLEAIRAAAARIERMIADLVDEAAVKSGQLSLQCRPVHLAAHLDRLLTRLAPDPQAQRFRLRVNGDVPPVQADPDRLDRILMNLLTNAEKYSDADAPIRVEVRVEDGQAAVSVTDEGQGIDPEDLPRIFERYYRSGRTHRNDSLGLGLYISRMLVQAHGGQLRATSEPGRGSTFTFSLPFAASV